MITRRALLTAAAASLLTGCTGGEPARPIRIAAGEDGGFYLAFAKLLAQQLPGFPQGQFGQQNQTGSQQPTDLGQDLVDLIQATIAPTSWDVNGGLGTIVYFGSLRVLVVSQTGEVHGNVAGLLQQLHP